MLVNVLSWTFYNPGLAYFGIYLLVGIALFLLPGIPALQYVLLNRAHRIT